ncbi:MULTISPECIES: hypothetical protein [Nocardia]|uniref:hypothetical protein n=1 Tax=Nocardia TaxID=1817 RepID=UPI002454906F|nr:MULTISPECIES: hypothetical protein [Nocardia]
MNLGIPMDERAQRRTISYTYRLIPAAHNRLLHFDVEQPTRGIDIELDYSDTDIAYVNMIDFIASKPEQHRHQEPGCGTGQGNRPPVRWVGNAPKRRRLRLGQE